MFLFRDNTTSETAIRADKEHMQKWGEWMGSLGQKGILHKR